MADFRFFKMAAVRHRGFDLRAFGPPTKREEEEEEEEEHEFLGVFDVF